MQKYFIWIATILWAGLIWRLTTTPQLVVTEEFWLQNILMMGAHFIFFGIQAVLIRLTFWQSKIDQRSFLSVSATSIFGLVVELRQLTIAGRSGDPVDWLLDTLGAITFLLLLKKLQLKI